ncbi:MAG: zf-HC2 domain-containing protein [Ignavibacteriaceae bacterium]|nr:zf-HC2 domain-containing protein [Ignavibacteriaceae bacterium]
MKHYEFEISQFLDNELPADEQKKLFMHLSKCSECAEVLSDFMKMKKDVKSVYNDMNVELKDSSALMNLLEPPTKKRNSYKTMFYFTAVASLMLGFFLILLEGNQSSLKNQYLQLQKESLKLQNEYAVVLNEKRQLTEVNKTYFDKMNLLKTTSYRLPTTHFPKTSVINGSYKAITSINKKRIPSGGMPVAFAKITKEDFLIPQIIGN